MKAGLAGGLGWLLGAWLTIAPATAAETAATVAAASHAQATGLAATARRDAARWGLTVADWQRAQALLGGLRGALSVAGITPIEVLGIHARDDAERRHYAEIWARWMVEDAQRVAAFQHEYDLALARLYPGLPVVDAGQGGQRRQVRQALRARGRPRLAAAP